MVRIAPTPSGFLHLGNAANFAANALLAEDDRLLLRIDDIDRARFRMEYLRDVFEVLEWLGIKPTDGPTDPEDFMENWSQETRLPLYYSALDSLRTRAPAKIFACPCSRKDLRDGKHQYDCPAGKIPFEQAGVAWRADTRGHPLHARMAWFAVRKKDGRPSYQLACTVDDLYFGITACARGEDLRDSTAAQALLSDLLGYPPLHERIRFLHHPLIEEDGIKLSKRQGALDLRSAGVRRDEVFGIARDWLSNDSAG